MNFPQEHISVTQINMYLRCPAQYYFRYVEGLKIPPSGALTLGKSVHEAFEYNYSQKIDTHEDLPVEDVKEVFADVFDKGAAETQFTEDEKPGELKDTGVAIVDLYQRTHAPMIQPVAVEKEFTIIIPEIAEDVPLLGYIDLVDDKQQVIDHKVYKKTPTDNHVQTDLQLSAYALAYNYLYGGVPVKLALDCLVKTKQPKIIRMETYRTQTDINRFINTAHGVVNSIKNEIFYPKEQDNFLCSPKWCGYWGQCHNRF